MERRGTNYTKLPFFLNQVEMIILTSFDNNFVTKSIKLKIED